MFYVLTILTLMETNFSEFKVNKKKARTRMNQKRLICFSLMRIELESLSVVDISNNWWFYDYQSSKTLYKNEKRGTYNV